MVDSDGNPVEFSDSEQFVDEAAQQGADSEPQIDLEDAMRKAEAMTQRVATRELLKEEASAESKEEEIDLDEAMRASEALTRAIEQRYVASSLHVLECMKGVCVVPDRPDLQGSAC